MKRTLGKSVSVILVLACMLSAFASVQERLKWNRAIQGLCRCLPRSILVLEDRRAAMGMFRLVVGTVLT